MPSRLFVFHHRWPVPAAPEQLGDALADVEGYPRWWPQVRSVERVDGDSGRVRIRSLLPMTLQLVLTSEIEDREGGVLRVALSGDLDGWARWTVTGSVGASSRNGGGSAASRDHGSTTSVSEAVTRDGAQCGSRATTRAAPSSCRARCSARRVTRWRGSSES